MMQRGVKNVGNWKHANIVTPSLPTTSNMMQTPDNQLKNERLGYVGTLHHGVD